MLRHIFGDAAFSAKFVACTKIVQATFLFYIVSFLPQWGSDEPQIAQQRRLLFRSNSPTTFKGGYPASLFRTETLKKHRVPA